MNHLYGALTFSQPFLHLMHIAPQQRKQVYSEHGQTGQQYLLLKRTHLCAKMFVSFWCYFFFKFSDMIQPRFRAFAKRSAYSQFQAISLLIFNGFSCIAITVT